MRGRWLSLRWRLTLLYALLVALLITLLGIFVYSQIERFMVDSIMVQAQGLARLIAIPPPPGGKPDNIQRLSDLTAQDQTPTLFAVAVNPNGEIMRSRNPNVPPNPPFAPPIPDAKALARVAVTGQTDIVALNIAQPSPNVTAISGPAVAAGDRGVRVILPFKLPNTPNGEAFIVITQSLHDVDAVLAQLRLTLSLGLFGAIVLTMGLGLPLAGISLRPLARVTATARDIAIGLHDGESDLSRRVNLPSRAPQDEVAQLVIAFNTMLDQIVVAFAAQKASEARTRRFVADASHELRSPLTALGGTVDVLLRGVGRDDPPTHDRLLRTMRREADRMGRLVIDLLMLARFDAADPAGLLVRAPLQLDSLVDETVAERQHIGPVPQQLAFVAADAGPFWMTGDAERLRAVVINLLDNAIHYTAATGHITVTLNSHDKQALLIIADDGEGIAPEHLPHIFERFYRVDPARARATGSAGLGLAIVKTIVEAHGGTISVDSTLGAGTTFSITLPLTA